MGCDGEDWISCKLEFPRQVVVQQRNGDGVGGQRLDMIWAERDEFVGAGYGMNLVVKVILGAIVLQPNGWICCGQNEARFWPLGAI